MKEKAPTNAPRSFIKAAIIVIALCWAGNSGRSMAQTSGSSDEQENLICTSRDFAPGNYVVLPGGDGRPQQIDRSKSGSVTITSAASGETWVAPVEVLEPRRVAGFTVPQLPAGPYVARFEIESGALKGQDFNFNVTPRMRLVPGKMWAKEGEKLTVEIKVANPSPAKSPSTGFMERIEVTLQSDDTSRADLSGGQDAHIAAGAQEAARFNIDIKRCPSANFTATSPGFEPLKFKVNCEPPKGPIPVVFVPGTAGSELDQADGSVYWIDLNTLAPGVLAKGLLDGEGKDASGGGITPRRALVALTIRLSQTAAARLKFLGVKVDPVPCNEEKEKGPCWAFLASIYGNFLNWAGQNFNTESTPQGFLEAPFDWRKGIGRDTRERLDRVVSQSLENNPGHEKVIIIAHSLGGLVSRDYVADEGRGKVAALIAAGTPWLGAPKTTRGLIWGYNFGVGHAIDINRQAKMKGMDQKVKNPLSFSFLDLVKARDVATTWPSVFQQLPTTDFMRWYGTAAGLESGNGKSVIFGRTPAQTVALHREKNPRLFDAARGWRDCHVFGKNDYGTPHYLIAGYGGPDTPFSDIMDMQMIESQSQIDRHFGGKILKKAARKFSHIMGKLLGGAAGLLLSIEELRKIKIYPDDYIAVESGTDWGDGTSPLLSATAGAQIKKGAEKNNAIAKQYLGPDTEVRTLELSPGFGHGSILDDPRVRWNIWRIYREQNRAIGVDVNPSISSIILDLKWKIKDSAKEMKFLLGEKELTCKSIGPVTAKGVTLECGFKKEEGNGAGTAAEQPPRILDLIGKALSLQLSPKGEILLKQMRLIVNEMEILNDESGTTLTTKGHRFDLNLPLIP